MQSQNLFTILHLLNKGGKIRYLIETLVEIVWQDMTEDLFLTEGAREYIQREVEYMLDYLAKQKRVKGRFIFNRVQALRLDLLKLKLACPRKEIVFSSLLTEDEDHTDIDNKLLKHFLPSSFLIEPELRERAEAKEKTQLRNFRLLRLKKWEIGCFLKDNSEKSPRFEQKSLF